MNSLETRRKAHLVKESFFNIGRIGRNLHQIHPYLSPRDSQQDILVIVGDIVLHPWRKMGFDLFVNFRRYGGKGDYTHDDRLTDPFFSEFDSMELAVCYEIA